MAKANQAVWAKQIREGQVSSYMAQVEQVAEGLRPEIESGRMRGYNSADSMFEDTIGPARAGESVEVWHRRMCRRTDKLPSYRLAAAVERAFGMSDDRNAALVIALSPSTVLLPRDDGRTLLGTASWAASWDVLRIAREGGWYMVTPGEEPSNAQLGLRRAA